MECNRETPSSEKWRIIQKESYRKPPLQIKKANSVRKFVAGICMLALVLVYAPIASATLVVATGACCDGDRCPIHGNHHSAPKTEETGTDCGHHISQLQSCSLSCCQNAEQPAAHAHVYLLMPVTLATNLALITATAPGAAPIKISPAFSPLAPPPKSLALARL